MRKRRSPRVVWLPQTDDNSIGTLKTAVYQRFELDVAGVAGDFVVGEIPIVTDNAPDPLATTTSLADTESSGYRLRRIVGKIFCELEQSDEDQPSDILVTAGFIIRRVDSINGISLASANGSLQSPGEIENCADPWIWRRTWLLTNPVSTSHNPLDPPGRPDNYSHGPAMVDGPHVDQKTARLVGPEERLFLDVSATVVAGTPQSELQAHIRVLTDLRCLGSMRTSSGNRRNASR